MTKEERWVVLFEEVTGRMPSADEREKGRATGFDFKQVKNIASLSQNQGFPEGNVTMSQQENNHSYNQQLAGKRAIWIQHFHQFLQREPSIEELMFGEDHAYDLATIHHFLVQDSSVYHPELEENHTKRNLLMALIIVMAVSISAYLYGLKYFSKSAVAERYISAVEKGDGNQAIAYEAWSDSQEDIDESALTYLNNETPIERSTDDIQTKLIKTGNTWLLFPKWRILVDPVTYIISSNTDGLNLLINGEPFVSSGSNQAIKTDSSQSFKAFRLYPSDYVFEAKGQVDDETIEISYTSSLEDLTATYTNQELSDGIPIVLNLVYLNTTVTSNLKEGEVFVDEQKIGTLKDGKLKIEDYAAVGTSHIYIRKTFKDNTYIESSLQKVEEIEGDSEFKLDAKVLTNDLAKQVIDSAFSKLSYPTVVSNLEESFEGGSNNSFYSNVNKTVERNTTGAESRAAKTVDMRDVKVKSIKQTSATVYQVSFTFVYDIYYEPASQFQNSGSILDTMEWSAEISFNGDSSSDNIASNYRIVGQLSEAKKTNSQNNLK